MTARKRNAELSALLRRTEGYLSEYVTFSQPGTAFVAALWAGHTYLWPHFDATPYLVITSDTKRSGKSRFAEILSFVSANSRNIAGMTPATIFHLIRDESPTLFMDEAESFNSEAASVMRSVLNVGYRKGQVIPRMGNGGVVEWPAYCPKAFILIGDVYDTLRDRSVVVRMKRAEAPKRFLHEPAKLDGSELGSALKDALEGHRDAILDVYAKHDGLSFLPDRDEEIWLPLFAICSVLDPDRIVELQRIAVDMATDKTNPSRAYSNLLGSERDAEEDEYSRRLVRDLLTVMGNGKSIYSTDALPKLHELPTGPWRRFRGEGLNAIDMSNMLSRFGLKPKSISVGTRRDRSVRRGYTRDAVAKVVRDLDAGKS